VARWNALDGITLSVIRGEIEGYLPLKVQKVQQPGKKELVFSLWGPNARERLVLSLEGSEPFFGFCDERKESPQNPPGFCLALRKRLEGGSLRGVRQQGLDRVLYLDFDGHDDFGGVVRYVLVFDMAGREHNIGLYKDDLLEASIIPSDEGRFEHRAHPCPICQAYER
jgi:predicted ribosome quality control (RQC) complex YloA/Tae2 family protein